METRPIIRADHWAADARRELLENILPFWRRNAVDESQGGFIAQMSNDLRQQHDARKALILNGRILWTFSAAYRYTGQPEDRALAQRAYDYLTRHFLDRQHGGYFWELDAHGRMADDKKKIYGQAFCLYALAEYHRTFADTHSLQEAIEIFHLIEDHSREAKYGGYLEVMSRDWQPVEDMRLSDQDLNEKKSMNNHLHVLEAYTNLLRVWPDPRLADRLRELLDIFQRHILNAEQTHFHHFFDEAWTPKSSSYTFGHDIEGSWLLCEAAEVIQHQAPHEPLKGPPGFGLRQSSGALARSRSHPKRQRTAALQDAVAKNFIPFPFMAEIPARAVKIARAVMQEGLDADGGLFYEANAGQIINFDKEWWPQAEAVVGFLNAWQLSGDDAFWNAARQSWQFIQNRMVDPVHGEWFWRVTRDGTPDLSLPKVSAWKCPYHNGRCCLEIIRRLQAEPTTRGKIGSRI